MEPSADAAVGPTDLASLLPPSLRRHPELLHDPTLLRKLLLFRRRPIDSPRLLICPLGCEVGRGAMACPSHCTNASCPSRGAQQTALSWLRKNMRVVRTLLPPHPPPMSHRPRLLLITTTYAHREQLLRLEHLARSLNNEPDLLWIVVEDAAAPSQAVARLLEGRAADGLEAEASESGGASRRAGDWRRPHSVPEALPVVPHVHLAYGPTRRGGNAQRNVALKYIRDRGLTGIVFNLDDDNSYHPLLWNQLRSVRSGRVGVLAVRRGVFPPPRCDGRFLPLRGNERRLLKVERPVYDNVTGRFAKFEAGWCRRRSWMSRRYGTRKFCVDMAGFAFDASLLRKLVGEPWKYDGHGGESEFIESLLGPDAGGDVLQPLANCGNDVVVFHNEWRIVPVPMLAPPATCAGKG